MPTLVKPVPKGTDDPKVSSVSMAAEVVESLYNGSSKEKAKKSKTAAKPQDASSKTKKQQKKKTDSGSGKAKGQGSLEGWLGKTVEANAGKKKSPAAKKKAKADASDSSVKVLSSKKKPVKANGEKKASPSPGKKRPASKGAAKAASKKKKASSLASGNPRHVAGDAIMEVEAASVLTSPAKDPPLMSSPAKENQVEVETAAITPTSSPPSSASGSGTVLTTSTKSPKSTPSSTKSSKSTPSSTPKSKSKSGKSTYLTMTHDAIVALKDRTGSSTPAICKYLLSNHPHLSKINPKQFKHQVASAIKVAIKAERFIKVKASYKINPEWVKKEKAALRKKEVEKRAKERKRKAELEKALKLKMKMEEKRRKEQEEAERKKKEAEEKKRRLAEETEEMKAKRIEELRRKEMERQRKEEEARKAKELADRIRRRRFPMDDQRLIDEDRELGVSPPDDVTKRPPLPCLWMATVPPEGRSEGVERPKSTMVTASSVSKEGIAAGNRGIVSDMFQVYHFFCGDAGFARIDEGAAAPFTLKHLMHALNEVLIGNARKARVVPPLISHLFVMALRYLVRNRALDEGEAVVQASLSPREHRLQADLSKLGEGLNSVSWAEICFYYMDAMERYYTSDASVDTNVLPGQPIEGNFFAAADKLGMDDNRGKAGEVGGETVDDGNGDGVALPGFYGGYLGSPVGALSRAHTKLARQDPWMLTAEELMALLRALTDDILAEHPSLARDISGRESELYGLLKAKRMAEQNFHKVRRAYEGPKQPKVKKDAGKDKATDSDSKREVNDAADGDEAGSDDENGEKHNPTKSEADKSPSTGDMDEGDKTPEEKKFVPTATKREFLAAEKAKIKATDAYEKGLKQLISRSEPIGRDRNFSNIYFFQHDPESVYVEVEKQTNVTDGDPMQSKARFWQVIDTKSLFDGFVSSLDVRGVRESDLYDNISAIAPRRHLFDDLKRKSEKAARERERKELERRLSNAKMACAAEEEGRRSGRLASLAQGELAKLEEEIKLKCATLDADSNPEPADYVVLTGLDILTEFESRLEDSQSDEESESADLGIGCRKLWYKLKGRESGAIGMIIKAMLDIESKCNELSEWERDDISRRSWINNLRDVSGAWKRGSTLNLGPSNDNESQEEIMEDVTGGDTSDGLGKNRGKIDKRSLGAGNAERSIPQLINALKGPLIDLEARVFTITGLKMAADAADEAGDDASDASSVDDDSAQENYLKKAQNDWKKMIHRLEKIPTGRWGAIREILISAISIARKAHLNEVVKELRSALLLHRPSAAGAAKASALEILSKHGGYEMSDDESEDFDPESDMMEVSGTSSESGTEEIPTLLCSEAMMMSGCLDGDDNADRVDWADAVKTCRTLSRFGAIANLFLKKASRVLSEIDNKKDNLQEAIEYWENNNKRTRRGGKEKYSSDLEIWANVQLTSHFCMAKVQGFPWWPARVCEPKDASISSALSSLGRDIVAFVGNHELHVVRNEIDTRPYTGVKEDENEDMDSYDEDTIKNFQQCVEMTRRICKGRGIIKTPKKETK